MGRRVQQLDTLENLIYVLISLLLIGTGIYSLVKGTLHYVFLITGGAALYFLIGAVSEFARGGAGAAKRGVYRLVLTIILAFLTYVTRICL